MAKLIVLALCAVATVVIAEPPSSYLPPQARNSPSSSYGAPFGGSRNGNGNGNGKASSYHSQRTGSKSFSYNSLHENQFGGAQSRKSFGNGNGFGSFGNGGGVSQQYGAPRQSSNGFGQSNGYRASGPSFGGASRGISQQYGAPSFGGSSNGFGAGPAAGFGGNGFGVSQQYGAPSFGGSGASFGGSNHRFGMSGAKFGGSGGSGYSAPAPVYGAPSSKYGAPYSKMDDDLSEPANYEYTYEVQAAEESGAEFGHQESREDESARGVYHVLLPDGRTQIVEYEADEEGFRPVIRYEESGGYPAARGPQGPY